MPNDPPTDHEITLAAAALALLPVCVDAAAVELVAPAIAARLAVQGGRVVVPDAHGRARVGRHGVPIPVAQVVAELRAEAQREGDWLFERQFRTRSS